MRTCLRCSGLVPEGSSGCPNCAVSSGGLKKVAALVGGLVVASGCLAVPVYGVAVQCDQPQVDGGSSGCPFACDTLLADGGDPAKDSENSCFVDGGTP